MGIAGFFLWLKQYYGKCIDNIPENVVEAALRHQASPDSVGARYRYDNLYIDMNGLLHPCCHDTHPLPEPKNEEEMFSRLFDQLDLLVKVVRPRKCLVLCVDGVAPRSKMNQQRIRRFHGVQERAEMNEIAAECAEEIEKELGLPRPTVRTKWDHNVITPATEFMDRMGLAVEWFLLKKLNEDPAWRHLTVVYSDAHVPGEGEHKIMQYIRGLRTQPGYHPNTSHVIHGMDADLICLGLSLHEEHVSILRNQLTETFQPDHNKFCYFNLHTYREALREDFANIKDMDFENVLDDFVYLCFFVGNDFLPHIPLVSIKTQGIELLLDHYVRNFDQHGYLTKKGTVDFRRLTVFLEQFVKNFMQKLRGAYHGVERAKRRATTNVEERVNKARRMLNRLKRIAEVKRSEAGTKTHPRKQRKTKQASINGHGEDDVEPVEESDEDAPENAANDAEMEKRVAAAQAMTPEELAKNILEVMVDMKKEQARFVADRQPLPFSYLSDDYREKYYLQKFGWDAEADPAAFEKNVQRCCAEYFRGTQWVMWYYTKGCPSWSWYYPYHYAPLLQDLAAFTGSVNLEMKMDAPLHPFEQLLAVLPRESVHGLPDVFYKPVMDPKSVLGRFYPDQVDVDFTEANFSYQGVLRLPFIDCDALHKAVGKVAFLEADRPITLVFSHEKGALAKQVLRDVPSLLHVSPSSSATANGATDGESSDKALVAISKEMAGKVPIAGRLGPCPTDRSWPVHAKIACPDASLAQQTSYGTAVRDNQVCVFRYEMESKGKYRPELLGAGGKSLHKAAAGTTKPKAPVTAAEQKGTQEPKKVSKRSRSRSTSPPHKHEQPPAKAAKTSRSPSPTRKAATLPKEASPNNRDVNTRNDHTKKHAHQKTKAAASPEAPHKKKEQQPPVSQKQPEAPKPHVTSDASPTPSTPTKKKKSKKSKSVVVMQGTQTSEAIAKAVKATKVVAPPTPSAKKSTKSKKPIHQNAAEHTSHKQLNKQHQPQPQRPSKPLRVGKKAHKQQHLQKK